MTDLSSYADNGDKLNINYFLFINKELIALNSPFIVDLCQENKSVGKFGSD